jgi:hypothetical protein
VDDLPLAVHGPTWSSDTSPARLSRATIRRPDAVATSSLHPEGLAQLYFRAAHSFISFKFRDGALAIRLQNKAAIGSGTNPRRISCISGGNCEMRSLRLLTTVVLSLAPGTVTTAGPQWERFTVPGTGAAAEIPVSIFDKGSDLPDRGVGRRFYTDDRRADLTVQSVANPGNDSPAAFLAKKKPPPGILYKRVTPSFFVVSSVRNDRIWYNRCNRSAT